MSLLPCPFCGGSATMEQTEDNRWSVGCDSADEVACMGYQNFTTFARRGEARGAWNKRSLASVQAARDRAIAECAAISETVATGYRYSDGGQTHQSMAIDCVTKAIRALARSSTATVVPSSDRYVHIDNVVYHLDDVEVDKDGKCSWTDVANALTHIKLCIERPGVVVPSADRGSA